MYVFLDLKNIFPEHLDPNNSQSYDLFYINKGHYEQDIVQQTSISASLTLNMAFNDCYWTIQDHFSILHILFCSMCITVISFIIWSILSYSICAPS